MNGEDATVLVVTDDETTGLELTGALERAGVDDVAVVAHAIDAWRRLDVGRIPRLVLVDFELAHSDSRDLLERIRADDRFDETPVVVLTGDPGPDDRATAYGLGANAYLEKPATDDELFATVEGMVDLWAVTGEE